MKNSDLISLNSSLEISYTVGIDTPFNDFFIPCLEKSIELNICSGFFSSSLLEKIIPYSFRFFKKGGRIRIICGFIYPDDAEILIKNNQELELLLERNIEKEIDEIKNLDCRQLLAYLLLKKLIEIKFAVIIDKNGFPMLWKNYMMHEKFGYFKDKVGNIISFSGSVNYTTNAWFNNFEEFKVFNNFEKIKKDYCKIDVEKFQIYWSSEYLDVNHRLFIQQFSKFPENMKKRILTEELYHQALSINQLEKETFQRINRNKLGIDKIKSEIENGEIIIKDNYGWIIYEGAILPKIEVLTPRKCQISAREYLRDRNYNGILSMATGSGKTIAALLVIYKIIQQDDYNGKIVVISVPDKYLVEQWYNEVTNYYKQNYVIKVSSEEKNWKEKLLKKISKLNIKRKLGKKAKSLFVIGVSNSLNNFYEEIEAKSEIPIIFVGDEIHSLGSPVNLQNLVEFNPDYRIGLSATPIRPYDESGTEELLSWFGIPSENINSDIFRYTIKEAQKDGILEEYSYFPELVSCSESTFKDFKKISDKIREKAMGNSPETTDYRNLLLIQRARKIKTEENKDEALIETILNLYENGELYDSVIYCLESSQIERIDHKLNEIFGNINGNLKRKTIDGDMENKIRFRTIQSLINHNIHFIFAMKCLDQGVDIPALKNAFFVSSSSTEREHIQRAGRVLRKSKNLKKNVKIYDYLVIPTKSQITNNPEISHKIFKIEKKRFDFFSEIASNEFDLIEMENELLSIKSNILNSERQRY